MSLLSTAPGKVVLLGEYAVLAGAPALVMAVDRRVRVSLAPAEGPDWSVAAPGWTRETACFRVDPAGVTWPRTGADDLALARHVIEAFFQRRRHPLPAPGRLLLDTTALMTTQSDPPTKLGLGSSAALTVALWDALRYYVATQQDEPLPELAELVAMHVTWQGNRGSGLDIAASLLGGVVAYRRFPAPSALPSALPGTVEYCFVWTGRPSSTGQYLADMEAWRRADERLYGKHMDSLTATAEAAVREADAGKGDTFLRAVAEYTDGLDALGRASGTDIFSAPHRRIREISRQSGVLYKPCGAGGGDIGVALSEDPEALARFRAGLAKEPFQILPLRMDRDGVTTQSGN